MMDKKIKRRWIAALRSGKYQQTREGILMKDGQPPKYCCLGVLCMIQKVDPKEYYGDGETSELITEHAAGLSPDEMDYLAKLNDGHYNSCNNNYTLKPHSFKQIATYVEKHL